MNFRHLTDFLRNRGCISKRVLERSSSTYLRRVAPCKHLVVTLDPSKFAEKNQRRLHIGNLTAFRFSVSLHNLSSRSMIYYFRSTLRHLTFPPGTTAFLYYFTPPEKPRIAGELRLRVASSDDHASFESGSDLLTPNGQPWSRSLYQVSRHYMPLYNKLREEGFVPDRLDAALSTFPSKRARCQLLYTLNDTFIIDFSFFYQTLFVITEQGVASLRIPGPCVAHHVGKFGPSYAGASAIPPFTGSTLARFERSTLPEHKGTRTVVIRFLKIITPVKCVTPLYYGPIRQPKEGELHRRPKKLDPPVWGFNIDDPRDQKKMRGFQLLWDATDIL